MRTKVTSRYFCFSLRTLFVLVTLFAVSFWGCVLRPVAEIRYVPPFNRQAIVYRTPRSNEVLNRVQDGAFAWLVMVAIWILFARKRNLPVED